MKMENLPSVSRNRVNSQISTIVHSYIRSVAGGVGISLINISLLINDLQELSDVAMELMYSEGYEDGCKEMHDKVYVHSKDLENINEN